MTAAERGDAHLRVGLLGCGHVSDQYLEGIALRPELTLVACADTDASRASEFAAKADARALTPDELYADDEVDVVLNLTPPAVHVPTTRSALEAGKHVYSEKPLATTVEDGEALVRLADERGLRLGCAPDTFLGAQLQTARKLIEDGWIGEPVGAVAFISEPGYEHFHPDVSSFYAEGIGPALDLGPYYVTALIHLLGPVSHAVGHGGQGQHDRRFRLGERAGEPIPVEAPTHVAGLLGFASGATATLQMSWDIWATTLPFLQIHGNEGSMDVGNPDYFDGPVRVRRADREDLGPPPPEPSSLPWTTMPQFTAGYAARGAGLADLAHALAEGRDHIASGRLALHALEVLRAVASTSEGFSGAAMRHGVRPPAASLTSGTP
jgi:predicted dehydrogenase